MENFRDGCENAGVMDNFLVVGGGNMARAMIKGAMLDTDKPYFEKSQVHICVRSESSAKTWKDDGFENVYTSFGQLKDAGPFHVLLLAVKPQMRQQVYTDLAHFMREYQQKSIRLIISVMAGVSLDQLAEEVRSKLDYSGPIVRLMPNMASSIGCGLTLMSCDSTSSNPEMIAIAESFAKASGTVHITSEKNFNSSAAVCSSSPAWTYMFIESLADGGVLTGNTKADSLKLAAQAVKSAAEMILSSGTHPSVLKDQVCSPNGTTIAGVRVLEKSGFRSSVMEAVKAASDRADEMK